MSTTHFVMHWKEVSWSPLAKEPGRAAWQHETGVQNLADVNLTLLDVLLRSVVTQRKRLSQPVMDDVHSGKTWVFSLSELSTSIVLCVVIQSSESTCLVWPICLEQTVKPVVSP